jgi:translation initiation factor eIF-2B subunit gamma
VQRDRISGANMPTTSMPNPGFQAVILCGPGVSFDTFTSKAEESPKALIPIANRPMVWYALDFCHRMGISRMLIQFLSSLIDRN